MERTGKSTSTTSHQVWGGIEPAESTSSSAPSDGRPPDYEGVVFRTESSNSSSLAATLPSERGADEDEPGAGGEGGDGGGAAKLALHEAGRCQPCQYMLTASGCAAGAACVFCHLPHKKHRTRPSKETRNQCKQVVRLLDAIADPQEKAKAAEQLCADSKYMNMILHSQMWQSEQRARPPGAAESRAPAEQSGAGPGKKKLLSL